MIDTAGLAPVRPLPAAPNRSTAGERIIELTGDVHCLKPERRKYSTVLRSCHVWLKKWLFRRPEDDETSTPSAMLLQQKRRFGWRCRLVEEIASQDTTIDDWKESWMSLISPARVVFWLLVSKFPFPSPTGIVRLDSLEIECLD
jgi:hypothetical protein